MKNTKFAKLIKREQEKDRLEYAPSSLKIPGVGVIGNPSKAEYLLVGWKEVIDVRPEPKEGFYISLVGYEEAAETITAVYEYVEIPKRPRHWTPLSVKRTAEKHVIEEGNTVTFWNLLHDLLIEMNYLEDFWGSQYVAEDDDAFKFVYEKACQRFTKEVIDKLIEEIPVEP